MKGKNIFMYSLAALIAVGFFGILAFLIHTNKFEAQVSIILGALVGAFTTIISYFYGSSKGSSDKNELLKK